ncbi:hypothetical protein NVP1063O_160 [Vibrio phage 1.063.O._10N.261.45.C7]|nr:hypothetical protein NVP1063O_160 [Vibrio phage 1.063.O._10N.261.45.C7]
MSELKFANTKWDVRTWTEEQKIKWQEKAFELGYTLGRKKETSYLDSAFSFLEGGGCMTLYRGDIDYFYRCKEALKTFEDMFPEEVETKQSIFTHPRWVTSLTLLGRKVLGITEGRDYRVIDVVYKGGDLHQYIICNGEGVADTYHISHFYKVTPEECTYLPSVEIETEEYNDFENVYYKEPNIPLLNCWYIPLKSLSQEQIDYIGENFRTDGRWSFKETENILMYQVGNCDSEYVWTNILELCDTELMHEVSFNDIFKEVN